MQKYRRSKCGLFSLEDLAGVSGDTGPAQWVATALLSGQHLLMSVEQLAQLQQVPCSEWRNARELEACGHDPARLDELTRLAILLTDGGPPACGNVSRSREPARPRPMAADGCRFPFAQPPPGEPQRSFWPGGRVGHGKRNRKSGTAFYRRTVRRHPRNSSTRRPPSRLISSGRISSGRPRAESRRPCCRRYCSAGPAAISSRKHPSPARICLGSCASFSARRRSAGWPAKWSFS